MEDSLLKTFWEHTVKLVSPSLVCLLYLALEFTKSPLNTAQQDLFLCSSTFLVTVLLELGLDPGSESLPDQLPAVCFWVSHLMVLCLLCNDLGLFLLYSLQSAAAAPSPVLGNIPPGDGTPGGPVPQGSFSPLCHLSTREVHGPR